MFTTAVADSADTLTAPSGSSRPSESGPPATPPPSLPNGGRRRSLPPFVTGDDEDEEGKFPVFPNALEQDLVRVFKLMSDETRLRILLYLAREGELHVSAMCERLGQSQPAVSHHLALLRNAEIIEPRRDGKHNFYSIRQERFVGLLEDFFRTVRDPETDAVEFDDFTLSKTN